MAKQSVSRAPRVRRGEAGRAKRFHWAEVLRGACLALIPLAVLRYQLVRWYPYAERINEATSSGDDWLAYKRQGVEILLHGWTLPSVTGNYTRPAGFLYNYFVAAVFGLFGINSTWVVIAQTTLIAAGAVVLYVTFAPHLSRGLGLLYLVALCALLFHQRSHWHLLLSESLLLILVPFFFYFLCRSYESGSIPEAAAGGFAIGLGVITRPNILLIPLLAGAVLWIFARRAGKRATPLVVAFFAGWLAGQMPLAIRNVAVTQSISPGTFNPAFEVTADWTPIHRVTTGQATRFEPTVTPHTYLDRLLFCFGIWRVDRGSGTGVIEHQLLIWIGALLFAVLALGRRSLQMWQALVLVFVGGFVVPAVLFSGVENYNGRLVLPVFGSVLLLAVAGLQELLNAVRARRTGSRGA